MSRRMRILGAAVVVAILLASPAVLGRSIDPSEVRVARVIAMRSELRSFAGNLLSRIVGRIDEALFDRPYGVSWDGDDLLITDTGRSTVVRISRNGDLSTIGESILAQPIAAVPCFDGIAVSDSVEGGVVLFDRSLRSHEWIASGLERPTGLACLGERLAVAETGNHRIVLLERDGTKQMFGSRGAGRGEFNFPTLVAADGTSLLVGDALNFRIQRFDADGEYVGEFGELGDSAGTMPRMKGIAVDGTGRIWVTDAWLDQIAVYQRDGAFLMNVGHAGDEPGAFAFPAGIAISDDGTVAVADSLNQRIQILDVPGGETGR